MLSDVDAQLAPTELRAVEAPHYGRLEFPWPDVALYTPNPGYTGPDTYTFAGRGPTRQRPDRGPTRDRGEAVRRGVRR
jgi:hypothetical protein